jgi:hypothetical protein
MDKAALEDKVLLGAKHKCSKNSNLDCDFGLCNCDYPEKET